VIEKEMVTTNITFSLARKVGYLESTQNSLDLRNLSPTTLDFRKVKKNRLIWKPGLASGSVKNVSCKMSLIKRTAEGENKCNKLDKNGINKLGVDQKLDKIRLETFRAHSNTAMPLSNKRTQQISSAMSEINMAQRYCAMPLDRAQESCPMPDKAHSESAMPRKGAHSNSAMPESMAHSESAMPRIRAHSSSAMPESKAHSESAMPKNRAQSKSAMPKIPSYIKSEDSRPDNSAEQLEVIMKKETGKYDWISLSNWWHCGGSRPRARWRHDRGGSSEERATWHQGGYLGLLHWQKLAAKAMGRRQLAAKTRGWWQLAAKARCSGCQVLLSNQQRGKPLVEGGVLISKYQKETRIETKIS
jgi:hypothetical protein